MRLSKRIAAGVLSAMLAVSMLAGCGNTANKDTASSGNNSSSGNNTSAGTSTGNSNTNNSSSSASSEPENVLKTVTWTNSKTNQYFKANGATSNKCYFDATVKYLGEETPVKIAVEGKNLYIYFGEAGFENRAYLFKNDAIFVLDSKSKTYDEYNTKHDGGYGVYKESVKLYITFPTETNSSSTIITSKERLYGTIYDCEMFRMDDAFYRYCYEGTELRYILMGSQGYVIKINKLTASPDSKLFEIPEGYTKAN